MSKAKSTGRADKLDGASNLSAWNKAIADSEALIGEYEEQVVLLRESVRSFKTLCARGAPFPAKPPLRRSKRARQNSDDSRERHHHLHALPDLRIAAGRLRRFDDYQDGAPGPPQL